MKAPVMVAALIAAVAVAATGQVPHRTGGFGAPIGEAEAGRVIPAGLGTTAVILLKGNAGTGYRWMVMKTVNVTMAGPLSVRPAAATPPGFVGGATTSVAHVRLDRPGRAEVVFGLIPPGRGRPPARTLRYRFAVR